MITFKNKPVYLACGVTDMRYQINGLAQIVEMGFKLNPTSPALFVFCNRPRKILKILEWDSDGFVLYTKRLERGSFRWPHKRDCDTMRLSAAELNQLIAVNILEQKLQAAHLERRVLF